MKNAIFIFLILLPLPFGSVAPVWQWLIAICIACMTVIQVITGSAGRKGKFPLLTSFSLFFLVALVVWGSLQSLTLYSPEPLYGGTTNCIDCQWPASVNPESTISFAMFLTSHILLFLISLSIFRHEKQAMQLLTGCGLIIFAYSLYGIGAFFWTPKTILFFEKTADTNILASTFINRNNFAAYAGLGLQCLISTLLFRLLNRKKRDSVRVGSRFDGSTSFLMQNMWYILAIYITGAALILTQSRAGIASVALAISYLIIRLRTNFYHLQYKRSLVFLAAALTLIVVVFNGAGMIERFDKLAFSNERFIVLNTIFEAIEDRTLTGFGLGTFADAFPLYRDEATSKTFVRAHNDYLELIMSAGVPAASLLFFACLGLLNPLRQALVKPNKYGIFIILGLSTSVQLGAHALVDFPLQIPAISYTWCIILAATTSMAYNISNGRKKCG